jgi:hypothetical protein
MRVVQWSNDALSTFLDLYGIWPWVFLNQGLGRHLEKTCDTFLQKVRGPQLNVMTNGTR